VTAPSPLSTNLSWGSNFCEGSWHLFFRQFFPPLKRCCDSVIFHGIDNYGEKAMATDLTVQQQRSADGRKMVTRGVSYPFISLGDALDAAQKFYQAERKTAAPVGSATAHFGYAESSSGGRQTISALIQFGLLEDEGRKEDRHVRLTQRALAVLLSEPDSPERKEALIECIQSPKIYRDVFGKWPEELPSDQTISFYLQREKNFNPKAIGSFIRDLRSSLSLVGVEHPGELNATQENPRPLSNAREAHGQHDGSVQAREDMPQRNHAQPTALVEYYAPPPSAQLAAGEKEWLRGSLSKDTEYRLLITGTIGSKQIGRLIKLLEAQKAVLDDDDDEL
jgi:hypothetical protein